MTKTQLAHNMKIDGGFLSALTGLISFLIGTVLPALGVWALSGLASTRVQKAIGNGLYLKNLSGVCQIVSVEECLYLGPAALKDLKL